MSEIDKYCVISDRVKEQNQLWIERKISVMYDDH